MVTGINYKGILDIEACWKGWIELGTLQAVRDKLGREGKINPKTNEPPTVSAIEKAAYRWAISHQDEARKDLEYAWSKEGIVVTDDRWKEFLEKASGLVFYQHPKKLSRFDAKYGLERE